MKFISLFITSFFVCVANVSAVDLAPRFEKDRETLWTIESSTSQTRSVMAMGGKKLGTSLMMNVSMKIKEAGEEISTTIICDVQCLRIDVDGRAMSHHFFERDANQSPGTGPLNRVGRALLTTDLELTADRSGRITKIRNYDPVQQKMPSGDLGAALETTIGVEALKSLFSNLWHVTADNETKQELGDDWKVHESLPLTDQYDEQIGKIEVTWTMMLQDLENGAAEIIGSPEFEVSSSSSMPGRKDEIKLKSSESDAKTMFDMKRREVSHSRHTWNAKIEITRGVGVKHEIEASRELKIAKKS